MDSLLSFPVGLFHPLQHAGLSRRSPSRRQTATNPSCSVYYQVVAKRRLVMQRFSYLPVRRTNLATSIKKKKTER